MGNIGRFLPIVGKALDDYPPEYQRCVRIGFLRACLGLLAGWAFQMLLVYLCLIPRALLLWPDALMVFPLSLGAGFWVIHCLSFRQSCQGDGRASLVLHHDRLIGNANRYSHAANSQLILRNFDLLEALARRLQVRSLSSFGFDGYSHARGTVWHSPREMLHTLNALSENAILHSEIPCTGDPHLLAAALREFAVHLRRIDEAGALVALNICGSDFVR